MTLELVFQYFSYVIFSYNNIEITITKVIQVPLILFAMWFVVTHNGRLIHKTLLARKMNPDALCCYLPVSI